MPPAVAPSSTGHARTARNAPRSGPRKFIPVRAPAPARTSASMDPHRQLRGIRCRVSPRKIVQRLEPQLLPGKAAPGPTRGHSRPVRFARPAWSAPAPGRRSPTQPGADDLARSSPVPSSYRAGCQHTARTPGSRQRKPGGKAGTAPAPPAAAHRRRFDQVRPGRRARPPRSPRQCWRTGQARNAARRRGGEGCARRGGQPPARSNVSPAGQQFQPAFGGIGPMADREMQARTSSSARPPASSARSAASASGRCPAANMQRHSPPRRHLRNPRCPPSGSFRRRIAPVPDGRQVGSHASEYTRRRG
jgi:hypothetical protein